MTPQLRARWQALAVRERIMVAVAGVVVLVGLVYALLFEPAWQGRERLQSELPKLRADLAAIDAMAREAKELSSQVSAVVSPDRLRAAVEASLERAGLASQVAQLAVVGEAVELRLRDAPFAALLGWLSSAQRELRVRPTQVEVAREQGAGLVTARVLLDPPRNDAAR